MGLPFVIEKTTKRTIEEISASTFPGLCSDHDTFVERAMNFIVAVKAAGDDVYRQLLELLLGYEERRLHLGIVATRAQQLFRGHPDLWAAFLTYLPDPQDGPVLPEGGQRKRARLSME